MTNYEKEPLELLGRNSYREITKNDVIKIFQIMNSLDDKSKEALIKNMPQYLKSVQEAIKEFCDNSDKAIKSTSDIQTESSKTAQEAIKALRAIAEKPDINATEAMEIAKMIVDLKKDDDKQNDKAMQHIEKYNNNVGWMIVTAFSVTFAILAGTGKIKLQNFKPKNII